MLSVIPYVHHTGNLTHHFLRAILLYLPKDPNYHPDFTKYLTTALLKMPPSRHVAAIPYPGRGHVNPMMNFCRLLLSSNQNLLISFVVTEEWLGLISDSGDMSPPANLRLVTIPNVIPSEFGRAKEFAGFLDSVFTKMEEPVEGAMDLMDPPVEGIFADTCLPWVAAVGRRRNVRVFSLFAMSASFFSVLYWWDKIVPVHDGRVAGEEEDEPLGKYLPGHNSLRLSDLHYICASDTSRRRALEAFSMMREAQCILFTSFYELESQVIDTLRQNLHCPVYPIGPSIPYMKLNEKPKDGEIGYVGWLNSQPKQSVLYVSLGSFLSVSATQMDEIAMGLSLSGTRFFWVARGDSSRLQEMVCGNGMVVPWCDQLRVLSNDSIGRFLTHCGWNSTLEGVFCGVPMITFPIFWDQPVDSRLIVDEWKVGLSLRGEVGRDGMVGREQIALVVKRLMNLDGESMEIRKRAAELRDFARGAIEAGGSSAENVDSFVRDLIMHGC